MALKLRLTGWALFLAGCSLIIFVGRLSLENPVTWVGIFVTVGGTICTSACNLIASRAHLRRTQPPPEPLTAESAARARELIRERKGQAVTDPASRPEPGSESSPPSPPSTPD